MRIKRAIVTGGTSGVGLSIVKALVAYDYNVSFIGTNKVKGHEIEKVLNAKNQGNAKFVALDLSLMNQVQAFIDAQLAEANPLDLLVNVAGLILPQKETTSEGIDKTFAVGFLSAYKLSNGLIPLLANGENARIANVSGIPKQVIHARLDFEDFNFTKNYNGFKTAIATIHAKTVFTEVLAHALKPQNIDVNAFHPGFVRSNLSRNMHPLLKIFIPLANLILTKKSSNGIYVAMAPELNGITGQIFANKKAMALNFEQAYKEELINKTEQVLNNI